MSSRGDKPKLNLFNSLKKGVLILRKKAYKQGPKWYKKWSDKDYSSVVHSSLLFWISAVFVAVFTVVIVTTFINQNNTNKAHAGSYSVTWTSVEDFEYNQVTTGTPTLNNGIDMYAAPGYLTVTSYSQGTLRKFLIDAGEGAVGNWSNISGLTELPYPETEAKFRTRGSEDNISWPSNWDGPSGAGNNDYFQINGGQLTTPPSRYLEIEITLVSNGDYDAFLDQFTVTYNTIDPPTSLVQYSRLSPQIELVAGSWWSSDFYLSSQLTCLEDSPCHGEYEFKKSGVAFDGLNTVNGAEVAMGATGASIAGFSDVLGEAGDYVWRVRFLDNAGRSTGWINYNNGQPAIRVEKTVPTGNIIIENGESFTQGPTVHFSISAADSGGSSLHNLPLRFSNDNQNWSVWEALSEFKVWDLEEGIGTRTVYMQIRDNSGNVSTVNDSISTDNSLPTTTFDSANKYPATSWNVKENINSAEFRFNTDKPTVVYIDYGESSVTSEASGEPNFSTTHNILIKGLKSNTSYRYRIRFIDELNNMGTSPSNADSQGGDFYTFTTGKTDIGFEGDPTASNLSQVEITASTAKITWKTKVPTSSWVDYGLTNSYGNTAGDDALLTAHIVELKNLVAGETYHYRVRGLDSGENEFVSNDFSFKAIMNPEISNVKIDEVTSYSARVTWTTNVKTDSDVAYGETTTYSNRSKDPGLLTTHSVRLDNLTDNVTYHFQVEARDEYGNATKSQDYSFTTPLDTVGPKISDVRIDMLPMAQDEETATVIISWKTDKAATGKIEYGEGLVGGKYEKSTIEDTSLNYVHTAIVRELTPATTYHFRLVSKDKNSNQTESFDYNIVTHEKQKSIWQLIVRSLEETFNWLRDVPKFWISIGEKIK